MPNSFNQQPRAPKWSNPGVGKPSCLTRAATIPKASWLTGKKSKAGDGNYHEASLRGQRQDEQTLQSHEAPRTISRRPGVLVVDDDKVIRELLELGLDDAGFDVYLAGGGMEAVEVFQRRVERIDLVLLDVCMPGLNGPQTLAVLRIINPSIRCCFMSGNTGSYTQSDLLQLGASHLFNKPFGLPEVGRIIRRIIERSGSPDCFLEGKSEKD
jgi:CheY-like chemotaxis protein